MLAVRHFLSHVRFLHIVFVKRPELLYRENHLMSQALVNLVLKFVLNEGNMLNEKIIESTILSAVKRKPDNRLCYNRIFTRI